jgi:hypothetical protein
MNMPEPFDSWLESNLRADLDRARGGFVPGAPRYRARPSARRLRILGLSSIPMALSLRLVTALAAAGLAAGGAAVVVNSHPAAHNGAPGTSGKSGTPTTTLETSAAPSGVSGTSSVGATPTNHGQAVTGAVASCKAARTSQPGAPKESPGNRGIGACVSQTASDGHGNNGSGGGANATPKPHPTPPPHPTPKPHPTPH